MISAEFSIFCCWKESNFNKWICEENKYSPNEIYWTGYLYRYFAYTYEKSSVQIYKIVKPKELRGLYLAYHTMDTAQAIDRILEAKGLATDNEDEIKRQYEIFKKIRSKTQNKNNQKHKIKIIKNTK